MLESAPLNATALARHASELVAQSRHASITATLTPGLVTDIQCWPLAGDWSKYAESI